ncbi:MAG: YihY/virulence factor BrkB family protein [Dermatophilaceae bacterium]
MTDAKRRIRRALARVPGAVTVARIIIETVRVCLRYRVTGLASEAGFFALLSLPPLVLGLFGGLGYVGRWLGPDAVQVVRQAINDYASRFVTADVIDSTLAPTVDDVLRDGRFDLVSLGFVLSLWSGSRALNVFVDTIAIMYGQSGQRGIVPTRALSFSLYVVALVLGVITIPLVLLGPSLLGQIIPKPWDALDLLYWPVVVLLVVGGLASLYHVSTPRRSPWRRDVPGAVLTLMIWLVASFLVRGTIAASLGGSSIYGPLSAPIVLLIWLYFLAIAVLIGAAFNAATKTVWPVTEHLSVVQRVRRRLARRDEALGAEGCHGGADDPCGDDHSRDGHAALDLTGLREAAAGPLTPVVDVTTRSPERGRAGPGDSSTPRS